ncbi:hypothetical protein BHE74_00043864 [Ensete ventricosum]|nr:hypothetical protein BHE74_00043864 [Ensete ventricosum]
MCSEDRSSNRKNRRTGIARPSSWRSSSHLPTPCRSRSANPVRECQFGVAHSQRKSMMRRPRPSQTRSRGWPKKTRPSGLPRMTSRSTAKPPVSELESPKLKTTARLPHVDSAGSAAGEQRETHRSQQAAAATEKPTPMAWIITKTRRDGGFVAVGMRERERERERPIRGIMVALMQGCCHKMEITCLAGGKEHGDPPVHPAGVHQSTVVPIEAHCVRCFGRGSCGLKGETRGSDDARRRS